MGLAGAGGGLGYYYGPQITSALTKGGMDKQAKGPKGGGLAQVVSKFLGSKPKVNPYQSPKLEQLNLMHLRNPFGGAGHKYTPHHRRDWYKSWRRELANTGASPSVTKDMARANIMQRSASHANQSAQLPWILKGTWMRPSGKDHLRRRFFEARHGSPAAKAKYVGALGRYGLNTPVGKSIATPASLVATSQATGLTVDPEPLLAEYKQMLDSAKNAVRRLVKGGSDQFNCQQYFSSTPLPLGRRQAPGMVRKASEEALHPSSEADNDGPGRQPELERLLEGVGGLMKRGAEPPWRPGATPAPVSTKPQAAVTAPKPQPIPPIKAEQLHSALSTAKPNSGRPAINLSRTDLAGTTYTQRAAEAARKYRAANPHIDYWMQDISPKSLSRKIPVHVEKFPPVMGNLDAGYSATKDKAVVTPAAIKKFNPESLRGFVGHELVHGTQRKKLLPEMQGDWYMPNPLIMTDAREAMRSASGVNPLNENYYSALSELEGYAAQAKQNYFERTGKLPTTPAGSRAILQHAIQPKNWGGKQDLPSMWLLLRDLISNGKTDEAKTLIEIFQEILPGVVKNTQQPQPKVAAALEKQAEPAGQSWSPGTKLSPITGGGGGGIGPLGPSSPMSTDKAMPSPMGSAMSSFGRGGQAFMQHPLTQAGMQGVSNVGNSVYGAAKAPVAATLGAAMGAASYSPGLGAAHRTGMRAGAKQLFGDAAASAQDIYKPYSNPMAQSHNTQRVAGHQEALRHSGHPMQAAMTGGADTVANLATNVAVGGVLGKGKRTVRQSAKANDAASTVAGAEQLQPGESPKLPTLPPKAAGVMKSANKKALGQGISRAINYMAGVPKGKTYRANPVKNTAGLATLSGVPGMKHMNRAALLTAGGSAAYGGVRAKQEYDRAMEAAIQQVGEYLPPRR
jgi:hypothetical protein